VVFDIMDVPRILQGSNVSIFRSLPSWKVVKLLGSPERHPRSLRGRWRFLRGILVVFDIRDVPWIHQGSYVSIFRSLPSWEEGGQTKFDPLTECSFIYIDYSIYYFSDTMNNLYP
jgi:hypothetical protein